MIVDESNLCELLTLCHPLVVDKPFRTTLSHLCIFWSKTEASLYHTLKVITLQLMKLNLSSVTVQHLTGKMLPVSYKICYVKLKSIHFTTILSTLASHQSHQSLLCMEHAWFSGTHFSTWNTLKPNLIMLAAEQFSCQKACFPPFHCHMRRCHMNMLLTGAVIENSSCSDFIYSLVYYY